MNSQNDNLNTLYKESNYKIMEFRGEDLLVELSKWTRLDIINWLSWNDKNGVYSDEQSLREFNNILTKDEAMKIMVRQISASQ